MKSVARRIAILPPQLRPPPPRTGSSRSPVPVQRLWCGQSRTDLVVGGTGLSRERHTDRTNRAQNPHCSPWLSQSRLHSRQLAVGRSDSFDGADLHHRLHRNTRHDRTPRHRAALHAARRLAPGCAGEMTSSGGSPPVGGSTLHVALPLARTDSTSELCASSTAFLHAGHRSPLRVCGMSGAWNVGRHRAECRHRRLADLVASTSRPRRRSPPARPQRPVRVPPHAEEPDGTAADSRPVVELDGAVAPAMRSRRGVRQLLHREAGLPDHTGNVAAVRTSSSADGRPLPVKKRCRGWCRPRTETASARRRAQPPPQDVKAGSVAIELRSSAVTDLKCPISGVARARRDRACDFADDSIAAWVVRAPFHGRRSDARPRAASMRRRSTR